MKRRKFDVIDSVDVFFCEEAIHRVSLSQFSVKQASFRTRRLADYFVKRFLCDAFFSSSWFQSHKVSFDDVYRHRVFVQGRVVWSLHFLFKYVDSANVFDTDMCRVIAVKCYEPK